MCKITSFDVWVSECRFWEFCSSLWGYKRAVSEEIVVSCGEQILGEAGGQGDGYAIVISCGDSFVCWGCM